MEDTVQYTAANELWAWKPDGNNNHQPAKPTGVTVDVIDVSYSVLLGSKYKRLLRNVNLHLDPVCR